LLTGLVVDSGDGVTHIVSFPIISHDPSCRKMQMLSALASLTVVSREKVRHKPSLAVLVGSPAALGGVPAAGPCCGRLCVPPPDQAHERGRPPHHGAPHRPPLPPRVSSRHAPQRRPLLERSWQAQECKRSAPQRTACSLPFSVDSLIHEFSDGCSVWVPVGASSEREGTDLGRAFGLTTTTTLLVALAGTPSIGPPTLKPCGRSRSSSAMSGEQQFVMSAPADRHVVSSRRRSSAPQHQGPAPPAVLPLASGLHLR
jgi:hypothetical protein